MKHTSAKASHYNEQAKDYDAFNEENSAIINKTIESILAKYGAKTVLDLTCGTGSQVFWLTKRGFQIVGADINDNMLKVARTKAKKAQLPLKFIQGDMRTLRVGQFDAVLSIFNAIGHLSKRDFEKVIKNAWANLNEGGLFIFDINNLSYLLQGNNITSLTIDWQSIEKNKKVRAIQYSTIDKEGILASYTTLIEQKGSQKPKVTRDAQTLQTYTAKELRKMLEKQGFKVARICGINGLRFKEETTDRLLVIAKKSRKSRSQL